MPDSGDVHVPGGKSKKSKAKAKSEDEEPDADDLGVGPDDGDDDEEPTPKRVKKDDHNGDGEPSTLPTPTGGTPMGTDIDLSKYSHEDLVKYVEGLEDTIIAKDGEIESLKAEKATAETKLEKLAKADASEDEDIETILAKVDDPQVAAVMRKMHEDTVAAKAVADAEREARIAKEMDDTAADLEALGVPADEMSDLLKSLHEQVTPETYESVVEVLAKSAAVVETADIFSEIGKGGTKPTGTEENLAGAAEEIRKADPSLTQEQAIAKALEEHPEMYAEYISDTAQGGN